MTGILKIEHNPTFAPNESVADPERLISGDPHFKSWPMDESKNGAVRTGVWEGTPGVTHSIKGESFEFCHLLEGVIELTPKDGEPVVYRAGESFVMKPGFVGVWKTIETVRKLYVIVA